MIPLTKPWFQWGRLLRSWSNLSRYIELIPKYVQTNPSCHPSSSAEWPSPRQCVALPSGRDRNGSGGCCANLWGYRWIRTCTMYNHQNRETKVFVFLKTICPSFIQIGIVQISKQPFGKQKWTCRQLRDFSPPAKWGSLDFNKGATPLPAPGAGYAWTRTHARKNVRIYRGW